jgi:hypothetical protein
MTKPKAPRQAIREAIASQCSRPKAVRLNGEPESVEDWMIRTGLAPEVLESHEVPRVGYPRPKFAKRGRGGEC